MYSILYIDIFLQLKEVFSTCKAMVATLHILQGYRAVFISHKHLLLKGLSKLLSITSILRCNIFILTRIKNKIFVS